MKTLSIEQQKISDNTIKDSGVITFESWHSKCGSVVVTNINLNKQPGFYAERIYTLTDDKIIVLRSKDWSKIFKKYCEIMTKKLS